jgi:hypothetical protein
MRLSSVSYLDCMESLENERSTLQKKVLSSTSTGSTLFDSSLNLITTFTSANNILTVHDNNHCQIANIIQTKQHQLNTESETTNTVVQRSIHCIASFVGACASSSTSQCSVSRPWSMSLLPLSVGWSILDLTSPSIQRPYEILNNMWTVSEFGIHLLMRLPNLPAPIDTSSTSTFADTCLRTAHHYISQWSALQFERWTSDITSCSFSHSRFSIRQITKFAAEWNAQTIAYKTQISTETSESKNCSSPTVAIFIFKSSPSSSELNLLREQQYIIHHLQQREQSIQ